MRPEGRATGFPFQTAATEAPLKPPPQLHADIAAAAYAYRPGAAGAGGLASSLTRCRMYAITFGKLLTKTSRLNDKMSFFSTCGAST
jgi:hypothetical protein